jgi:hypothetical protein
MTWVLQEFYKGVTRVSQECCKSVAWVVVRCNIGVGVVVASCGFLEALDLFQHGLERLRQPSERLLILRPSLSVHQNTNHSTPRASATVMMTPRTLKASFYSKRVERPSSSRGMMKKARAM